MKIKISVIICCYKQAHYLKETIDSVLNQTYKNYEIVVVNDGSPDNVDSVVSEYLHLTNFVYVNNKINLGLGSARNIGVLRSSGDWIFILDSDDIIDSTYFEKAVSVIKNNKTVVYADKLMYWQKTKETEYIKGKWVSNHRKLEEQAFRNHLPVTCLMSKEIYNHVEGYIEDRDYMIITDWDMWIKLMINDCELVMIDEPLLKYRVHEQGMTAIDWDPRCDYWFKTIKSMHANSSRKIIRNLYLQILKREPDEQGLNHYMNSIFSYDEIKNQLLNCDEYRKLNND